MAPEFIVLINPINQTKNSGFKKLSQGQNSILSSHFAARSSKLPMTQVKKWLKGLSKMNIMEVADKDGPSTILKMLRLILDCF